MVDGSPPAPVTEVVTACPLWTFSARSTPRTLPKIMDNSQYSGSKEGEDQGSKEVVEEKKGVRVVEDQRVVKEVEGDSQLEV